MPSRRFGEEEEKKRARGETDVILHTEEPIPHEKNIEEDKQEREEDKGKKPSEENEMEKETKKEESFVCRKLEEPNFPATGRRRRPSILIRKDAYKSDDVFSCVGWGTFLGVSLSSWVSSWVSSSHDQLETTRLESGCVCADNNLEIRHFFIYYEIINRYIFIPQPGRIPQRVQILIKSKGGGVETTNNGEAHCFQRRVNKKNPLSALMGSILFEKSSLLTDPHTNKKHTSSTSLYVNVSCRFT